MEVSKFKNLGPCTCANSVYLFACNSDFTLCWRHCVQRLLETRLLPSYSYIQNCHCGAPLAIPLSAFQYQGWMVAMSLLWHQTIGSCTSLQRWALIRTLTLLSIIPPSPLSNLARNGMLCFYSVLRKCKTLTVLLQSLHQAHQQSWFPEGLLQ